MDVIANVLGQNYNPVHSMGYVFAWNQSNRVRFLGLGALVNFLTVLTTKLCLDEREFNESHDVLFGMQELNTFADLSSNVRKVKRYLKKPEYLNDQNERFRPDLVLLELLNPFDCGGNIQRYLAFDYSIPFADLRCFTYRWIVDSNVPKIHKLPATLVSEKYREKIRRKLVLGGEKLEPNQLIVEFEQDTSAEKNFLKTLRGASLFCNDAMYGIFTHKLSCGNYFIFLRLNKGETLNWISNELSYQQISKKNCAKRQRVSND